MKFESLSLHSALLRSLQKANYATATPIQAQAIPPLLAGRDLVGCAQTGTGKTAAFVLPTLQLLMQTVGKPQTNQPQTSQRRGRRGGKLQPSRNIRSLILSPTRELAAQIGESLAKYGQHTSLKHTVVYGGVNQRPQVRALQAGVDVLVATPGRLLDLVGQGFIDLATVEILILDEADHMLDMGFIHDLTRIVNLVENRKQTLMFSATMPPEIRKLADQWLTNPVEVNVAPVASTPQRVSQAVFFVESRHKGETLTKFLRNTNRSRTLVFSRTKRGADRIAKSLEQNGIRAEAIHGNKSQARRQAVIRLFNSKRPPVLVATDVAARGLDFPDVSHVINYDLPEVPETYVHRIGRTARAGAEGQAVSFCSREERKLLRMIERLTGVDVPAETPPKISGKSNKQDDRVELPPRRKYPAADNAEKRPGKPRKPLGKARPARAGGGNSSSGKSSPGRPAHGENGTSQEGGTQVATRRRKFSKSSRGRRYGKSKAPRPR